MKKIKITTQWISVGSLSLHLIQAIMNSLNSMEIDNIYYDKLEQNCQWHEFSYYKF